MRKVIFRFVSWNSFVIVVTSFPMYVKVRPSRPFIFPLSEFGRSRDSSIGITRGYGFDFQTGKVFLFSSVQTGSRAHSASHAMDKGAFSPAVKHPGCEADYSPPSNAKVKNGGAIPPVPRISSWRGA
jgi:hypothetical protein